MHFFPRKNWNPTTAEEESEKKGNNQVLSRSVTVSDYLPDKPARVCLYSPYMLLEPADEKLIILLFLEASDNDLALFFLVSKIKKDKYCLIFQKVS
jgi:hypothetical protein